MWKSGLKQKRQSRVCPRWTPADGDEAGNGGTSRPVGRRAKRGRTDLGSLTGQPGRPVEVKARAPDGAAEGTTGPSSAAGQPVLGLRTLPLRRWRAGTDTGELHERTPYPRGDTRPPDSGPLGDCGYLVLYGFQARLGDLAFDIFGLHKWAAITYRQAADIAACSCPTVETRSGSLGAHFRARQGRQLRSKARFCLLHHSPPSNVTNSVSWRLCLTDD